MNMNTNLENLMDSLDLIEGKLLKELEEMISKHEAQDEDLSDDAIELMTIKSAIRRCFSDIWKLTDDASELDILIPIRSSKE